MPATDRESYPCPADRIVCPGCGKLVHNLTVGDGWTHTTCTNNGPDGRRCYQDLFVASISGGGALVVPISQDEGRHLREATGSGKDVYPNRVLKELGVYTLLDESA